MLSIFLQNVDAEQMIDKEREDRETGKEEIEAWEGEASDNIGARAEDYIASRKLWDNFEKKIVSLLGEASDNIETRAKDLICLTCGKQMT